MSRRSSVRPRAGPCRPNGCRRRPPARSARSGSASRLSSSPRRHAPKPGLSAEREPARASTKVRPGWCAAQRTSVASFEVTSWSGRVERRVQPGPADARRDRHGSGRTPLARGDRGAGVRGPERRRLHGRDSPDPRRGPRARRRPGRRGDDPAVTLVALHEAVDEATLGGKAVSRGRDPCRASGARRMALAARWSTPSPRRSRAPWRRWPAPGARSGDRSPFDPRRSARTRRRRVSPGST